MSDPTDCCLSGEPCLPPVFDAAGPPAGLSDFGTSVLGAGFVIGNDRPDEDFEYPATTGMSPWRLGFGATRGFVLIGAVGDSPFDTFVGELAYALFAGLSGCPAEVVSMVGLRRACGLAAIEGFLPTPFVGLASGATPSAAALFASDSVEGDCKAWYLETMSPILPCLACNGLAEDGGTSLGEASGVFVVAGMAIDCGLMRSEEGCRVLPNCGLEAAVALGDVDNLVGDLFRGASACADEGAE